MKNKNYSIKIILCLKMKRITVKNSNIVSKRKERSRIKYSLFKLGVFNFSIKVFPGIVDAIYNKQINKK
ncbi:hypothetical protein GM661_18455 [Iocasia frigidifontis]|uniref:Uncharacterized protein n=1 Tax=Iocasia fonsfrigidae TaxID=2682810 RepID=A0A8A7KI97_9FIRM|nr:hypothetical protein [Iocasia fonsfrigidae]QTL99795.1 hypothetical protein GM661_18455 [Iocasia fonsfrigidae]